MIKFSCPDCSGEIFDGEAFCENCGRSLRTPESDGTLDGASQPATGPETPAVPGGCVDCGPRAEVDSDGYCSLCGLRQPGPRDHAELVIAGAAGVTDLGKRHAHNEDAMAAAPVVGGGMAAVVCDGVSSSPTPEDASAVAAATAIAILAAGGADPKDATLAAMRAAAQEVADLASSPAHAPATTYVSALVVGAFVAVGWIGDSRAYWIPVGEKGGAPALLTRDDTVGTALVDAGQLAPEEVRDHREGSILTAWLGADAETFDPHLTVFEPPGPGAVVVCSDGLFTYLDEPEALAAAAPEAATDPARTARDLVEHALASGGHDNTTVVIIPFPVEENPDE
jgi:serine/threonine protein phosphatase PrpC